MKRSGNVRVGRREHAVAVVVRTERCIGAVSVDPRGKSGRVQLPSGQRVVHHASRVALGDGATAIRVGDLRVTIAANHYRFQTLAAHDGAKTRACRLVMPVADDTRESHQVLASRPDDRGMDLFSETVLETVNRLRHGESPEVFGGNERGDPVVDEEHARDGGGAVNDEAIEATALEGNAKRPLGPRLADPAG